jgi:hypothetical protein
MAICHKELQIAIFEFTHKYTDAYLTVKLPEAGSKVISTVCAALS